MSLPKEGCGCGCAFLLSIVVTGLLTVNATEDTLMTITRVMTWIALYVVISHITRKKE